MFSQQHTSFDLIREINFSNKAIIKICPVLLNSECVLCNKAEDNSTRDKREVETDERPLYSVVAGNTKSKQVQVLFCGFCKKNGTHPFNYLSHMLKDVNGKVMCPMLRRYVCPICGAVGDWAHTLTYCPNYNKSEDYATQRKSTYQTRKPFYCNYCRSRGESVETYSTHNLKQGNRTFCPLLRQYKCKICHATGDFAHTEKYCELKTVKLRK